MGNSTRFLALMVLALGLTGCSAGKKPAPAAAGSREAGTKLDGAMPGDASPQLDAQAGGDAAPTPDAARPMDAAPASDARVTMDATTPADSGTNHGDTATPMDANLPPAPVNCLGTVKVDAYVSDPKLCVYEYAQNLAAARQMAFAPNGDLFVNNGQVTALWDADHDGTSSASERAMFATASGLNHGLVFSRDAKFVYASSDTTVYRWSYTMGQRTASGAAEVVIKGIPGGGHGTRALVFDSTDRLYMNVGSASNVDTSQTDWDNRSQIRRYTIPASVPSGGLAYTSGEVIATGMRNESGLFVDADDHLWGVENGRDNLSDDDLGGDIHNDNPGEELNFIDGQGASFYGYPLCFSEHTINGGLGRGTQWADQTLDPSLQKTDAFCRDTASVHPPAFVMPAHWAPLGVIRYTGRSLPFAGDLIISAHGSWNRQPAVGRVVAIAHLEQGRVMSLTSIVGEKDASGQLKEGGWNVRPVDVRQGPDDAVYVSDDQGGRVLKIGYQP
jgi:glucose/arabinose dehydrogenase